MSPTRSSISERIDRGLLLQLSTLPVTAQRWLKAALLAIDSLEPAGLEPAAAESSPPAAEKSPPVAREGRRRSGAPGLDELISGGASLEEQIAAYPELAEELRELAEIADLLRETGRRRRRTGEDILRGSEGSQPRTDENEDEAR